MKLAGVELVQVDLPFRQAIGTAAGVHRVRPLLFVRVVTDEAEGWGECAALEDGTAVDPTLDVVEKAAEDLGVPRLYQASAARGGELPLAAGVAQLFGSTAVDRHAGRHLRDGGRRRRAAGRRALAGRRSRRGRGLRGAGGRRGRGDSRPTATSPCCAKRWTPPSGPARPGCASRSSPGGWSTPVRAVRGDHPDLVLQVDANGSFGSGADDVALLNRLADFDVLCIEQPLPPADLVAHAQLGRRLAVPICLDESLSTPRRVIDALRNGACAMACLKPARLGGLRATRAAHAACAAAGVPTFVGGFFEAGLGRRLEPGAGRPVEPGRDGPGQRRGGSGRLSRRRPLRLPAGARRLGPGARCTRGGERSRRRRSGAARGAASLVPRHLHLTLHASRPLGAADQRCPHPARPGAGGVGCAE